MKLSELIETTHVERHEMEPEVWMDFSYAPMWGDCPQLDESTYHDIFGRIDPNFLMQKIRADALQGIEFAGFNGQDMSFWVKSSEYNTGPRGENLRYLNTIRFVAWNDIGGATEQRPIDRARELMFRSDLKLNCTCPSFRYHGYQFLLDQIDASIYPEKRPPNIRNPQHRGIVCKHMNRTLRSFAFYSGNVARQLRMVFGAVNGRAATSDVKSKRAQEVKRQMADMDIGLGAGDVVDATYREIT